MDTTLRVLLLERDQTESELMEMQFRKASIRVNMKRVPTLELLLAEAAEAPPDLVLANFALPRFDAAAAIAELKKVRRGIPWIIYSLNGNEETAVACMKAGAADFILKKHISRFGVSVKQILERAAEAEAEAAQAATEHKESEKEHRAESHDAQAAADLFRRIVERSPDLIAVLGLDGRREYNNPAFTDILEDPDILAGTDSFLDILPEDRERIRQVFLETVQRGYGQRTEYRLMDREGETRYMQSNSGVILNEEGDPEKIVVISRDVTDMTRDRQRMEMLLASTAGLAGDDFFSVMVHRLGEALGARAALVTRFEDGPKGELQSIGFWSDGTLQAPPAYGLAGMPCEKVIREGQVVSLPSGAGTSYPRLNTLAGMQVEAYVGVPMQAPDGTSLGHVAVFHDQPMADVERKEFILRMIARRSALEIQRMAASPPPPPSVPPPPPRGEEGIRDQEARLRTAVDGLPFPVMMTDDRGMIQMVNPRLEVLARREAHELLGRRAWPLILNGGPWHLLSEEYPDTIVRPDKTRIPVTVFAIPCRNADGRISGTLGVLAPTGKGGEE